MNTEIRNKNNKLRNQIRRKQIQSYFVAVRTQITQAQKQKELDHATNQEVKQHTLRADISSIYNVLVKDKNIKNKLSGLTKQNLVNLLQLLIHNLSIKQSSLILKQIIQAHYTLLFLDASQQKFNKQIVSTLYQQIFQGAYLLSTSKNNNQTIKNILDGYLSCILQLIFHQSKENQQKYCFSQVCNPQSLKELLIHIDYLFDIPNYLSVLCVSELNYNIFQDPTCRAIIQNKPQILHSLLVQVNNKKLALPCLMLINSFINIFITNKSAIIAVLPSYLQKIQLVYNNLQSQEPWSKLFIFCDMLENAVLIFQTLSPEILDVHLGQIMSKAGFWIFSEQLFRIQTQTIRKELFSVIKYTVQNMLVNNVKIQKYISYNLVSYVVEGIESNYAQIIWQNLEILVSLLRYSYEKQGEQSRLLQQLAQCGVSASLQNLQYYSKEQIAQKACQANKLLQQCCNPTKMIQE